MAAEDVDSKKMTLLRQHPNGRVLSMGRTSVPGPRLNTSDSNMDKFCGRTVESAERGTVLSFLQAFVQSSLSSPTDSLNKQMSPERNFGLDYGQDQPKQR